MAMFRSFFLLISIAIHASLFSLAHAQDVSIESVNLRGFEGCSNLAKITKGWEDAINMANTIKESININEAAALEYLGPPSRISKFAHNIKDIFDRASTFGQGAKGTPTLFKWDVYVRCDDYKNRCRSRTGAYTTNYKQNDPQGGEAIGDDLKTSTPLINFCPYYFTLDNLTAKVDYWKDKREGKLDLWNYNHNTATVILHELMHAAIVTYEANSDRRIYDLAFRVGQERRDIYGPANVKILARSGLGGVGGYATTNADSLALYALAKYVQRTLTIYPHKPVVEKEHVSDVVRRQGNGALTWNDSIVSTIDPFALLPDEISTASTCDIDQANNQSTCESPAIVITEPLPWTPNSEYPPEYIAQWQAWQSGQEQGGTQPGVEQGGISGQQPADEARTGGMIKRRLE